MYMEDLFDGINEWSYQRFARFYGFVRPSDPSFKEKIVSIYNSIIHTNIIGKTGIINKTITSTPIYHILYIILTKNTV